MQTTVDKDVTETGSRTKGPKDIFKNFIITNLYKLDKKN